MTQRIPQGYCRFPSVFGGTVAFVSDDDIWSAPLDGSAPARRLTASQGRVSRPRFSPDGKWIAFSGSEEGHEEIYIMPAEGGPVRRLTHLGEMSRVVDWKGAKILFASNAGQAFLGVTNLFLLDPDGGQPERLPFGPATSASFGPGGAVALERHGGDLARWKRYRGGRRGQIWLDADGDGNFEKLPVSDDANVASPMLAAGRLWFLSDAHGAGNLHSCALDGGDPKRHTGHEDFFARNAATDGERIVYHAGGDLWLYDIGSGEGRKVEVSIPSPRSQRARKFVGAERYLEDYAVSPDGALMAVTARGKSFAFGSWEGPAARHESDGARHRLVRWIDDERVALFSDASGDDRLEIHSAEGGAEPLKRFEGLDLGRPMEMKISPDGEKAAVVNHRHELIRVDLETGEAATVERSEASPVHGFDWSPDSRWIAYSCSVDIRRSAIKIHSVETGANRFATRPILRDMEPAFDPEGRYLYFLSTRFFDPVYDQVQFDASFPKAMRPCLVTLRKDVASPFLKEKSEGFGSSKNGKKKKDAHDKNGAEKSEKAEKAENDAADPDGKKEEKDEPKKIEIDFDGIEGRILSFPADEGIYHQIAATKDRVFFTWSRPKGSLKRNIYRKSPPRDKTLLCFDLDDREEENFTAGVTNFELSRDGSALAIRSGNSLRVAKADGKPGGLPKDRSPGRKSGWVDLARLNVPVDPGKEWRQMLREAWRLQRCYFWTEDMSGVDWDAALERYEPLADRIATRSEFSDLMWEMQGELGTSHAYELGGDYRPAPDYSIGQLGADLSLDAERDAWRIDRIARGDLWNPESSAPLLRPGLNIAEGSLILAINGQKVGKETHPNELLVNLADELVRLALADPDGGNERSVVVETISNETPLRYRDWVDANRAFVHGKSGGKVGYIHVPNMGPVGYAEFHRGFLTEMDHEGLIVDVRYNGGGHVSSLLLEKLARKRIGYDVPRWMAPTPYPEESVKGPIVCLTNENAGSDGDIFSHAFKKMKLGKLVGTRTWGGVVGIWPRNWLVDGGVTTQPEFATWYFEEEWGLENFGAVPDIHSDNAPQDWAAGRDAQLEKALEVIEQEIAENPSPPIPEFGNRPNLAPPKLS